MDIDLFDRYMRARRDLSHPLFQFSHVRDLTITEIIDGFYLVTAVDSDGAIGPKPSDVVRVGAYECGRFGTRVPLMEMLACGAVPIAAFDQLAVEMHPTGTEIIRGVRDELASAGLPADFPISGSTEDNVPTMQTGMGVVILGIVAKGDFRPGTSQEGDGIYCIGIPKSGPDDRITLTDPEIADAAGVAAVCSVLPIHDALPVGSKGILYEAEQLAASAHLRLSLHDQCSLDLKKSGGPSTCFLISIADDNADRLRITAQQPVTRIGTMETLKK
jgi:hypothetical protein